MKLILDINNPDRKYTYNAYTTHLYEDGSVQEDCRIAHSDDFQEFQKQLNAYIAKELKCN
jgi:hypothetical protein